jgi:secretion/DNA translocation related TadE-like protein
MVAFMAMVWMLAMIVVQVGIARVSRHRAQSAADLAALAAASWALSAPQDACERAAAIAGANGARLDSCSVSRGVADVSARVSFTIPVLGDRTAVAVARAGPVGSAV